MTIQYPIWASSSRAASAFGVSTATVRRWAKTGKITSMRTPGGAFRYDIAPWMPANAASVAKAAPKARKAKVAKVEAAPVVAAPAPPIPAETPKPTVQAIEGLEHIEVDDEPAPVVAKAAPARKMDPKALKAEIERLASAF